MTLSYSSIAHRVPGVRDPALARLRAPWGFLLHTTGGGVTDKARKTGKRPIDVAIAVYIASQNGSNGYLWGGPHYVCDHDGELYQVAPDEALTAHAGGPNRAAYLDGSWASRVSPETVAQWHHRWPTRRHPYSMFPSTSPNVDYVGLEMIPIGDGFGGEPMAPGLRFTHAQHDAAIALGQDLAARHGWPAGWYAGGRLVCHEDVDPIERSDAHGGWDPGVMRRLPYFDLEYIQSELAAG
jgi:hypothetical protein